ncbi:MAG: 6-phosphogluconolactonase [Beggiatoa sp. IS2]|nr:MAG: 6-phosphogluconolactonase [Beggiatoa sp. IS2]
MCNTRWHLLENPEAVAQEARQRIVTAAHRAITERGHFRIVLAGGQTPEQTYRLLRHASSDWAHWYVYYGDERCVPEDAPERNSVMAASAWLNHVAIPKEHIFPIPAHLGAAGATARYADVISTVLPFDMVLLGLGEDGHTASLFPGHAHPSGEWVHAVYAAPKPPPERVSLSVTAFSNTRQLLFLVTGVNKRAAVTAWRRGECLPAAQVCPQVGVDVLLDRAILES